MNDYPELKHLQRLMKERGYILEVSFNGSYNVSPAIASALAPEPQSLHNSFHSGGISVAEAIKGLDSYIGAQEGWT